MITMIVVGVIIAAIAATTIWACVGRHKRSRRRDTWISQNAADSPVPEAWAAYAATGLEDSAPWHPFAGDTSTGSSFWSDFTSGSYDGGGGYGGDSGGGGDGGGGGGGGD